MEQTKALGALEPFLALTKSATSPRAAADLITRATSAPNTFVFTELLQAPQVQALGTSAEFAAHLTLLHIFSYGTYSSYQKAADLPALNDAQTLKLRQLSLLTLAGNGTAGAHSYVALSEGLGLSSHRDLEDLVISAVYAGLVNAQLDSKNQTVLFNNVAALRDVASGAISGLLTSLQAWADRCDATLASLEAQIENVRVAADRRAAESEAWKQRMDKLAEDEAKGGTITETTPSAAVKSLTGSVSASVGGGASGHFVKVPQRYGKRGSGQMDGGTAGPVDSEAMDVDDNGEDGKNRASRRKLQG